MRSFHPALFAALVLIVPACSGDVTVPPPLLSDTFSGTFPAPNWTVPTTTGTGTTTQISGGVLAFKATTASSSALTTTQMTFAEANLTISLQMSIDTPGLQGTGLINILNGSTVVASVSWDSGSNSVTYTIQGSTLGPLTSPTSDGTLNTFRFTLSSGMATWSLNNVAVNAPVAFTAGQPLSLEIGASFGSGTSWPEIDFDNVSVTSP